MQKSGTGTGTAVLRKRPQLPRLTTEHKATMLGLAQDKLASTKDSIELKSKGNFSFEDMTAAVNSVNGLQEVIKVLNAHVHTTSVSAPS